MLTVMTFNIGILGAIISGIVVGELLLGCHSPPSHGLQHGVGHGG
jgi:hypothetical protein